MAEEVSSQVTLRLARPKDGGGLGRRLGADGDAEGSSNEHRRQKHRAAK